MKRILIFCLILSILLLTSCDTQHYPPSDSNGGGTVTEDDGHTHCDKNNDQHCDVCAKQLPFVLDIYAINDLHGKLFDTDSNSGADELTTYLELCRKNNQNTVVISSGDMWQGTSESNLTEGRIVTEWMNRIGCASMTLGNHEFDWGEAAIQNNLDLAEFPFLAINVYNNKTGKLADYCTPSTVVDLGSIEVGIIGAIGDCYSSISPDKVSGVNFKVGKELTALVKAESQKLRSEGVDVIIYSLHDGNGKSNNVSTDISANAMSSYYDVELSEGYVDVVFEAHSHQRYVYRDRAGVYHLQGGGDNSGITHASMSIDTESMSITAVTAETIRADKYASLTDSPIIAELKEKYSADISRGDELLCTLDRYMSSSELCSLAARMYAEAGESFFGGYDIVLGGGYLSARSPYQLDAGEVYYKDIHGILPFDNGIVLCSVKGKDLLSKFINTSNSNYYVHYTSYGNSVKNSIDYNATYYIVTDTYTAYYAPNKLTVVAEYTPGIYARDLIADYLKQTLANLSDPSLKIKISVSYNTNRAV